MIQTQTGALMCIPGLKNDHARIIYHLYAHAHYIENFHEVKSTINF